MDQVRKRALCAAALLAGFLPAAALAHGGGGGGGHGGGHTTYTTVYIPGGIPEVPAAKTGDTSAIHSVAIVTAIGQNMMLGRPGWLAQHKTIDISDWKLDDEVDATLRRYLAGRFTFVNVPYDAAALAAIPNGKNDTTVKNMQAYLGALHAQGVDAFVVVRPDAEGDAFSPGLSLDNNDSATARPTVEANYEIDIVDAKSLAIVSHTLSRVTLRQGDGEHFAALLGSMDINISPDQTPSDAQRAEMKKAFSHLVSISLVETLRSLNLGVALPQPGARVMVPIPKDIAPFQKVTNVAVVSAVGDSLDLNHRAPFFVHSATTAPIADWNLDAAIESDVRAALDKRFVVKPVPVDRAKIAALNITIDQKGIATTVDGLTATGDIDAYIVVLKRTSPFGLDDVKGLGVAHQTSIGDEHTTVFAIYEIAVVDPHTLKPLMVLAGRTSPLQPIEVPVHVVPNTTWPQTPPLSPDQARTVEQALTDMMADSIPETLMRMGLTGMMPNGEAAPAPSQSAQAPAAQAAPSAAAPKPVAGAK
jgi:hypothetical protein